MDRHSEVQLKYQKVCDYLEEHALDGVYLARLSSFAWFSAGGDARVENHSQFGVASLLITKSKRFLLTNNIELQRILREQLTGIEDLFEVVVYDWFDRAAEITTLRELTQNLTVASDSPSVGLPPLDPDFLRLRYQLTDSEVERARWLSRETAEAVEAAARAVRPGMSEFEIESDMASEITARGILPVVLLVAADDRNFKYRHPVPSAQKLTRFGKLVCCARKWGLVTALTRSVYIGKMPEDLRQTQEAVAYVDAVYIDQTQPGESVANIFNAGKSAYEQVGFPGEWRLHHQGGAIGYEAREYLAFAESPEVVQVPQMFAWNPSIYGNKSEDTILISHSGTEVLTQTDQWPLIEVKLGGATYLRPHILEL